MFLERLGGKMEYLKSLKKYSDMLYDSICTIKELRPKVGVINNLEEYIVYENVKCRVSIKSSSYSSEFNTVYKAEQVITLFTSPDINIKPGSIVIVEKDNDKTEYKSAGVPRVYELHQEVELIRKIIC